MARTKINYPLGGTGLNTKFHTIKAYTGNAPSTQSIAHGLGTTPSFVVIIRTDGSGQSPVFWTTSLASGFVILGSGTASNTTITSVDATNVVLGTSNNANAGSVTFELHAFINQ